MKKKIYFFILAVCFCLFWCGMTAMAAGNNQTSPVLKRLQVNKKVLKAGETLEIRANISSRKPIQRVEITYLTPITDSARQVRMRYDSKKKVWKTNEKICSGAHNGIYRILDISVRTKDQNYYTWQNSKIIQEHIGLDVIRKNLNSCNFKVKGGSNDMLEPLVKVSSLKVSASRTKLGEKIKFQIKCQDESGIIGGSIQLYYIENDMNTVAKFVKLKYNKKTKMCEGNLKFNKYDRKGSWYIAGFEVMDGAGNYAYFTNSAYAGQSYFDHQVNLKNVRIELTE